MTYTIIANSEVEKGAKDANETAKIKRQAREDWEAYMAPIKEAKHPRSDVKWDKETLEEINNCPF